MFNFEYPQTPEAKMCPWEAKEKSFEGKNAYDIKVDGVGKALGMKGLCRDRSRGEEEKKGERWVNHN